jgi:hypothetical protein
MKQKPELEQMIENIHTIRWQIDALIVEGLLNQANEDIEYYEKATEYLKKAVAELICPASTKRLNAPKPTPMDTLKDVLGL